MSGIHKMFMLSANMVSSISGRTSEAVKITAKLGIFNSEAGAFTEDCLAFFGKTSIFTTFLFQSFL